MTDPNAGGAGVGGAAAPIQMTQDQLNQLITAATGGGAARRRQEKRLTPFSTGQSADWLAWRANFTRVASLNNWTDDEKRSQILAAMEGLACRQVQTVPVDGVPPANTKMTYTEVLDAYEQRFLPPAAGQMAREDFHMAKQGDHETVTAWHTRLVEIFCRAYPARDQDADTQLIEKFIAGLNHPTVQERTFVLRPASMSAALAEATSMVAAVRLINHSQGGPKSQADRNLLMSLGETELLQKKEPASKEEVAAVNALQSGQECFHCRAKGHFRNECPLRFVPREEAQRRGSGRGRRPTRGRGNRGSRRSRGLGRGTTERGGWNRGGRPPARRRFSERQLYALAGLLDELDVDGSEEGEDQEREVQNDELGN